MRTIRVIRISDDGLSEQRWSFWFYDAMSCLYVDLYGSYSRPTKRRKFACDQFYTRTDQRNNTITVDQVPLPDDVAEEAKAAIVNQITVKKWDRD
jgi:hypothetical protein